VLPLVAWNEIDTQLDKNVERITHSWHVKDNLQQLFPCPLLVYHLKIFSETTGPNLTKLGKDGLLVVPFQVCIQQYALHPTLLKNLDILIVD
jgi:hypothetical protein